MKKLLVISLLLVGCDLLKEDSEIFAEQIKNEVTEFCSCRQGIEYLFVTDVLVDFKCKDSTVSKSTGPLRINGYHIYGDCSK